MTGSSHLHRLVHSLQRVLSNCLSRYFVLSVRVALLSIFSAMLFVSAAMATDAVDRAHAIEIAKEQNGGEGKVLGVSTTTDSTGTAHYDVKLLSNGRVRVFTIKAAS